jgi:hypothetical protein
MMATAASGVFKKVARKREVTYGLVPSAASAQLLRRVKSTWDLNKDTYKSNEIRPDLQVYDFRHGVRRMSGKLDGELSPGAYSDELSSIVKRDFAAVTPIAGASITIAGTGPTWTVTRAAGSFLTDGVKVGDVIQLSVGTFNAANITKNLWVVALTATVATVMPLNGVALVAEGPIATSTVTVMGKKTFVPLTGHTSVSYSLEHFYSDISQSEVFSGIRYSKATINLPPTGIATITLEGVGQNITTAAAQYFTAPTALTTNAVVAAVNGLLMINGAVSAIVTGMSLVIDPAFSGDPVVGSNIVPQQFPGAVDVSGQVTMQFVDNVARDLFINETESSLMVVMTSDNTAAAQFLNFVMSRIKFSGATKDDSDKALIQTLPFQALLNMGTGGAGQVNEATSISIQDSAAP